MEIEGLRYRRRAAYERFDGAAELPGGNSHLHGELASTRNLGDSQLPVFDDRRPAGHVVFDAKAGIAAAVERVGGR